MRQVKLEYVWLDGCEPVGIRSKTRNVNIPSENPQIPPTIDNIIEHAPEWSYDGSSTNQAVTENSDLSLKPVKVFKNPFVPPQSPIPSFIVLCEVYDMDGNPHATNNRAILRDAFSNNKESDKTIFSVEQEYVLWNPKENWPAEWGEHGEYPAPQGDYYCGVGGDLSPLRFVVEQHAQACSQIGLYYEGNNAEVMKSQWEYQLGPMDAIDAADSLWISRYILQRVAESRGIGINYDPKPVEGDWNGSGAHINFSTHSMRSGDMDLMNTICEKLADGHGELMSSSDYGVGNERRLTGKHETSSIEDFSYGVSDRSASIRIPPVTVKNDGAGYLEDRRPAANMDPYLAYAAILNTIKVEENAEVITA